jgi:protein-tyrosine phosphatase
MTIDEPQESENTRPHVIYNRLKRLTEFSNSIHFILSKLLISKRMEKIKVLFVCTGNICRSPTAEGVFIQFVKDRYLTDRFVIDSAGTHAYHVGEAPDLRSQRAAAERGIDLSVLRARQVQYDDFEKFDFLLVMDDDNHSILMRTCPQQYQHKIDYFLNYAPQLKRREVPDPYYGGQNGFEHVLDMIEEATIGFLTALQNDQRLR